MTSSGVQFIELASGQPIPIELPADFKSRRFTTMAQGGGSAPRYAVGTAEGEVLLLKIGTTTEFSTSGERQKRPMIRAGRPLR